jgi:hypothetical protein
MLKYIHWINQYQYVLVACFTHNVESVYACCAALKKPGDIFVEFKISLIVAVVTDNLTSRMSWNPVAEFINPWLGDKVNFGIGLSYRHARLHGWRAGTTTLFRSWLYPPVRDLWLRLQITDQWTEWRYKKNRVVTIPDLIKFCRYSTSLIMDIHDSCLWWGVPQIICWHFLS